MYLCKYFCRWSGEPLWDLEPAATIAKEQDVSFSGSADLFWFIVFSLSMVICEMLELICRSLPKRQWKVVSYSPPLLVCANPTLALSAWDLINWGVTSQMFWESNSTKTLSGARKFSYIWPNSEDETSARKGAKESGSVWSEPGSETAPFHFDGKFVSCEI